MKIHTRSQAINEKCRECIYDSLSKGTWKDQVEACTSPSCALYDFRPVSSATMAKRKEEKFNAMTDDEKTKYRKKQEETRERFAEL